MSIMEILLWIILLLIVFFLLAAALPVRYALSVSDQGIWAEVKLLEGLWKKKWIYSFSPSDAEEREEGHVSGVCAEQQVSSDASEEGAVRGKKTSSGENVGAEAVLSAEPKGEDSPDETFSEGPSWSEVVRKAIDNGAARRLCRAAAKLWRHSRPREARADGEAGLGDPMYTGILQGWAGFIFPPLQSLHWNYEKSCFQAELTVRGRIIPLYAAAVLSAAVLSPPVRELWAYKKHGKGGE